MSTRPSRGIPEGLWTACPRCKATLYKKEIQARFNVCTECGHHFLVSARERINQLLDEDSFEEWFPDLTSLDPLVGTLPLANTAIGTFPGLIGSFAVPASVAAGTYFLILKTDIFNNVTEANESNNVFVFFFINCFKSRPLSLLMWHYTLAS